MWKSITLQVVAALFALLAAQISFNLLQKHLGSKHLPTWFDDGCPINAEKGKANCAAVLASPYATTNVKLPIFGDQTYPVAFLGWTYYSALFVWFLGVGRATYSCRWWHYLGAALMAAGLAGSLYYIFVMFTKLDHWCTWCMVTHVLNFGIVACVALMWPRKPKEASPVSPLRAAAVAAGTSAPALSRTETAHPSWRGVVATLLAMALVFTTEHHILKGASKDGEVMNAKATTDQCMANLNRILSDSERLARLWDVTEVHDLTIRPDDPIRSAAKPGQLTWDLVIFSDFECPTCKRTAAFIDRGVVPMFDHGLRVIYKHFPINKDCNPKVTGTIHANACLGVEIAEAARLQGGNEAFWRVHDLLYSKQSDRTGLAGINPEQIAKEAGLDPGRLVNDLKAPSTAQRLNEDATEAVKCKLSATPYLVLNGKPIDGLSAKDHNFWDKLADRYWKQAGVPRPDSTKLKAAPAATPGTPAAPGGQ